MDFSTSMSTTKATIGGTNVQVAVRCRPLNSEEKKTMQPSVVQCNSEQKTVNVSYGPPGKKINKSFTFDKVFGTYSTQEEVFNTMVRPIVDEALSGFNCTIFAYGQTGTGKTHTMEGDIHSEENAGIVPRSVKSILEVLEGSKDEFSVRVSFLELYNEELQDLLNTDSEKKLKLCEDAKKGVVCQNLEEIVVLNTTDIMEILQRGIQNRQTAATLCNKNSSRSHSIFTLKVMVKESSVDGEDTIRHGQLNLVDLAGSECVGRSGAKSERLTEAGNINKSLLTLGRVITALVEHQTHVPYRDSKLTRILQESLGGKAKTCIVATLSPSQAAMDESMSTLDYASRARSIKNQPTANQKSSKKVVLKEYCAELEQLRMQLQLTRQKNGVYVEPETFYAMENRIETQEALLNECEAALKVRDQEVKALKTEKTEVESKLGDVTDKLAMTTSSLESTTAAYNETTSELSVTKTELSGTIVNLEETTLELRMTEAVVVEQVYTESILHSQGSDLKNTIASHRDSIEKLLSKIGRLEGGEEVRINETIALVSIVDEDKGQLFTDVDEILAQNATDSAVLCDGIAAIMAKGRDTCEGLQTSVSQALNTLQSDAHEAETKMVSSCSTLKEHLRSTNGHLETTLTDMQQNLSLWLREVDSMAKDIQSNLQVQFNQLSCHQAYVSSSCDEMTGMTISFGDSHASQSESAIEQSKAMQLKTEEELKHYQNEVEVAASKAMSMITEKVSSMESLLLEEIRLRKELEAHYQAISQDNVQRQEALEAQFADTVIDRKNRVMQQRLEFAEKCRIARERQEKEHQELLMQQMRLEEQEAAAVAERKARAESDRLAMEERNRAAREEQERLQQAMFEEQQRVEEQELVVVTTHQNEFRSRLNDLASKRQVEQDRLEELQRGLLDEQIRSVEQEARTIAERMRLLDAEAAAILAELKKRSMVQLQQLEDNKRVAIAEQATAHQELLLQQMRLEEQEAAAVAERKARAESDRLAMEERNRAAREEQERLQQAMFEEQQRVEEQEEASFAERRRLLEEEAAAAALARRKRVALERQQFDSAMLQARVQQEVEYQKFIEQERRFDEDEVTAAAERRRLANRQQQDLAERTRSEQERLEKEQHELLEEQSRVEEQESAAIAERKRLLDLEAVAIVTELKERAIALRDQLEGSKRNTVTQLELEHQELLALRTQTELDDASLAADRKNRVIQQRLEFEEQCRIARERQEKEHQELLMQQMRLEEQEAAAVAERKARAESDRLAMEERNRAAREEQERLQQAMFEEQQRVEEQEEEHLNAQKALLRAEMLKVEAEREEKREEHESNQKKAFVSALEDMSASSTNSFQSSLKASVEHCASLASRSRESCDEQCGILLGIKDIGAEFSSTVKANTSTNKDDYLSAIAAIGVTRSEVSSKLDSVCRDVEGRRAHLDSTVVTLVEEVNRAIAEDIEVVEGTSHTATEFMNNLSEASSCMETSTSAATSAFVCYVDGHGADMEALLSLHFQQVAGQLQIHNSRVAALADKISGYGVKVQDSKTIPTGVTPKKTVFQELPELFFTKEHTLIKEEVRRVLLDAGGGSGSTEGSQPGRWLFTADDSTGVTTRSATATLKHEQSTCVLENANPNVPKSAKKMKCKGVQSSGRIVPVGSNSVSIEI